MLPKPFVCCPEPMQVSTRTSNCKPLTLNLLHHLHPLATSYSTHPCPLRGHVAFQVHNFEVMLHCLDDGKRRLLHRNTTEFKVGRRVWA